MERRYYLAGIAGAASLFAGCSGEGDGDATPTVTPAPVPSDETAAMVTDSGVDPQAIGDAHVSQLAGGNATVALEYAADTADGEPYELSRVVSTVDGTAMTYRRYVLRPLELGGDFRLFRGIWYDSGEAVTRLIEEDNRSIYREPDDFTPPTAAERFHREDFVATLAAYDPDTTAVADGYRLTADLVADPERLPTGDTVTPGSVGRLAARLEESGLLTDLRATTVARAEGDPLSLSYRVAVIDRGATTVERPDATATFEWYQALKKASPVTDVDIGVATGTDEDPSGMGEPPGQGGP